MTKNERIAALESRMTAVEQHCGIAPASATLAVGDSRVQPTPDVQPAEYVAGQAVECFAVGGAWLPGHFVCMETVSEPPTAYCRAMLDGGYAPVLWQQHEVRPCPASAGCVVMDMQSGRLGLVRSETNGKLYVQFDGATPNFDPSRHAVMLTPRQPAAPAEQPAPAAPAELAAKLTALAIVHQEYAPTLLEAAEQLQRQAAALTTARGVIMAAIPTMCEAVGDWHIDDVLAKIDTALGEQQ